MFFWSYQKHSEYRSGLVIDLREDDALSTALIHPVPVDQGLQTWKLPDDFPISLIYKENGVMEEWVEDYAIEKGGYIGINLFWVIGVWAWNRNSCSLIAIGSELLLIFIVRLD